MAITVERLEAEVDADAAGAIAELTAFDAALTAAARDRTATVNVDVDNGAAQATMLLDGIGEAAGRMASTVGSGASTASSALTSMGGAAGGAASGFSALGSAGGGATTVINNINSGFSMSAITAAMLIPQLYAMALAFSAIYAAATVAVGALHMLTAAAAGVYAALFPLVGLLGAIPVGLGAIGGGLGSVVLGMGGIMGAMKAMDTATAGSTRSTYNAAAAARELKSARMAIVDANKAVERAEYELQRATEGVAEAQEQAARNLVEQRRAVRNAVWAEEDAIDRLKRAQENLAKAQAGAAKSGAILSRETDDFTGKIYEVARISQDAVDGYDDQKQAQRELILAQEELERATARRVDQQQDLAIAERKGVRGSDLVRDALRRQEDAQMALLRAQDNVTAAHERLARVQAEQAERAKGGAAANTALANAMAKLTPVGRDFVRFLHNEFMPAWKTVQDAAQRGLLPGVEEGLRSLMKVFPVMADEAYLFAKGMGDAFAEIMAHFTMDEVVADLKLLSKLFREVLFGTDDGKMKGFMDAIIPLGDILIAITKAAGPMTKALTNDVIGALDRLASWMKKPANAKRMEDFFMTAYKFTKLWAKVLGPLAGIFVSVAKAAEPLATWMLEGVANWLSDIDKNLKTPEGFDGLMQWFEDMKPAIRETFGLVKDFFEVLFGPKGQGGEDSGFTKTIKALREDWIPAFEELLTVLGSDTESGPAFANFMVAITEAITELVRNPQAIKDFVDNITAIVSALATLVSVVQSTAESPAWDALKATFSLYSWGLIASAVDGWIGFQRENKKGINEWEAYTKPRIEGIVKNIAAALNFIPIAGPILSKVFTWLSKVWLGIIGIFASGDVAGAFRKKFESLAVDVRRAFARALNPVIETLNKAIDAFNRLSPVDIAKIGYLDSYQPSGGGNTGRSLVGSGSPYYNDGTGGTVARSTFTSSTTTRVSSGLGGAQFGGSIEGGQTYIVGEKRAELLTLPPGTRGKVASAVPRPLMDGSQGNMSAEQFEHVLERVLQRAKPNVDMKVDMHEHADPRLIVRELVWGLK